jgi:hypothetical protein
MKKILIFVCLSISNMLLFAQNSNTDFDNLKASNSPAFNMLGIANSDVEHPTELSDFAVNIKTATINLTAIPNNYAFEIAPFLLLRKQLNYKNVTVDRFNKTNIGDVLKQTFLFSFGMNQYFGDKQNVDSTSKMAIGIKFAIVRPKWNKKTNQQFEKTIRGMKDKLNDYTEKYRELQANDALLNRLIEEGDNAKIVKRKQELKKEIELEEAVLEKFTIEREGWFVDFTSGIAFNYPNNNFDKGFVNKAGAWLTGGYENISDKNVSALCIARYLYNAGAYNSFANGIHNVDMGARLLANDGKNNKYLISAEAVWRYLPQQTNASNWRLVANLEYAMNANQRLTFSFGRNYNGSTNSGGNLIAALNFIRGFGNKKYTNIDAANKMN